MNRLDYELGFASAKNNYSNADGMGQYKACIVKCGVLHPFNQKKRQACQEGCGAQLQARQPTTTTLIAEQREAESDMAQQLGQQGLGVDLLEQEADKKAVTKTDSEPTKKAGLGTGAIVGISLGTLAILGTAAYFIFRNRA